jgi:hypothetical protein
VPYFRGCSAQTCDLKFLSRSVSYRCFISLIDLPTTGPDALNSHAQTEQAQPWNRSRSTHTISRAKEHLPQERVRGDRCHHARWTRSQASWCSCSCKVRMSGLCKVEMSARWCSMGCSILDITGEAIVGWLLPTP